ncbi:hypothetical protein PN545_001020 [Cronobacter sakazakii]|nr:hypothetical protein [Cronobacter sakazakii]
MNNDELIAAGHELAKCLDSNTPLLDIAKMIVRLSDKLDVTTAALREKTKQCDALAAENAALKSLCEDRRTFIMNGVQLGYIQVPKVETDPALETIRIAVSPQEKNPATDAFLASLRAEGVEMAITSVFSDGVPENRMQFIAKMTNFAAQLRQGGAA